MELASLIISILAMLMAGVVLVWKLSEHFSTHKIQMVPIDDPLAFRSNSKPDSATNQIGKPLGADFMDFESFSMMTPEEKDDILSRMRRAGRKANPLHKEQK